MSYFSIVVVGIMTIFAVAGIVDILFFKNRLGLGPEFTKGMEMIGPLCISITGIISIVPLIAVFIEHSLTPLYRTFGLDPSMAVSTILAIDMGGFQLSESVALDPLIGRWAGIVYASMMGATIVFTIPVGLSTIRQKDIRSFFKGILFGIVAIPVGTFVAALILNIPVFSALKNLIIPILFSLVIMVCITKYPKSTIEIFRHFSNLVNVIAYVGLALAIIKDLVLAPLLNAGILSVSNIPLYGLINSTNEGIIVAGTVGLVLSGALPLVYCLQKILKKPLSQLSKKGGMSEIGMTGLLLTMANNMAMFAVLEKMTEKEQVLNTAFAVCAAFVIGDHLAFTVANAPEMIASMMIAKLTSGIVAILLASLFYKSSNEKSE